MLLQCVIVEGYYIDGRAVQAKVNFLGPGATGAQDVGNSWSPPSQTKSMLLQGISRCCYLLTLIQVNIAHRDMHTYPQHGESTSDR